MPIPSLLPRRNFLRLASAGVLGAALGLPAPALAARASHRFTFVVAHDLHYRDERCEEWLRRVVASIRTLPRRPAFVVLAGDLSEDGTVEQLVAVHRIFATLPTPVRAIIGNHDYTLTGERVAFEKLFGSRLNYRFDHAGCQFLALDTTQGRSVYRTHIPAETFRWLDATLPRLSRERPVIILTHFPLGRNWLRPVNTAPLLKRFEGLPLLAAFSGHWHGLTERTERDVHLSTGRCCSWWRTNHDGSPEKGYTLCHVDGGQIEHQFVGVT